MNRDDIVRQVIGAVAEVQQASGRSVEGVGPGSRPLKDLEGFDSLSGVEATDVLSRSLGTDLPDSVFAPEEDNAFPSVTEIADKVLDHVNGATVTG